MTAPSVAPALLTKEQVAIMTGRSADAIACAAKRHRADLAPIPIKIGRRNYWTPESVQAWVAAQATAQGQAAAQASAQAQDITSQPSSATPTASTPPRRGRPTKAEARAKAAVKAATQAAKAAHSVHTKEGE